MGNHDNRRLCYFGPSHHRRELERERDDPDDDGLRPLDYFFFKGSYFKKGKGGCKLLDAYYGDMEQQLKKEMKKERKKAERALRKAQRQEEKRQQEQEEERRRVDAARAFVDRSCVAIQRHTRGYLARASMWRRESRRWLRSYCLVRAALARLPSPTPPMEQPGPWTSSRVTHAERGTEVG